MNPERWQRIRELLEAVLERPPHERTSFLDQACGSDPEFRKEVESLINYRDEAERFLENPPVNGMENPKDRLKSLVGRTLSHYEIHNEIGRGGMGEVYIAEDTKLHRNVALKILPREMDSEERRQRFEREAQAIAALNHPNIVHVYSVEKAESVYFITMELVHGKTLSELIPKGGMPLETFLEIAIPLADAVSAAHEERIIHRDLKPDNLMVSDKGRLKILDFGLAKLKQEFGESGISELPTQSATGEGRILGTVAYMSPEQAEGKKVDHRSDIFSIGIILYEMVTGRRPFQGDTTASPLSSIIKDTPTSVMEVKPSLPHILGRIINRCLVKDPEHRYQTAKDVRNELEDLKRELDSGEVWEKAPATTTRPKSKWLVRTALVAAIVVAGVVGYQLRLDEVTEETTAPTIEGKLTQVTSQLGRERYPSLSPDGKFVVYMSWTSGNQDIYRQRIGGETAFNLTEDCVADDTQPSFSPDGELIAFRSDRDGGGIFLMGATGESVRRLTNVGFNPAWAPDGKEIVFSTEPVGNSNRGDLNGQLLRANIDTGEISAIEVDGDAVQPNWSPHGHRIAFWSFSLSDFNNRDIWTIPADGGQPVPITKDEHIDWNPVWSPDGKYIYFSSNRGGTMSLWRVPVEEETGTALGSPELVTTSVAAAIGHLTFSVDGMRIAYSAVVYRSSIQKTAFDPEAGTVIGQPVSIIEDSKRKLYLYFSPDGEWLAFNVMPGGGQADIVVVRSDGTGNPRNLTNTPQYANFWPRWSPDGSKIAFYSQRSGSLEIWTIKPDGGELRQLTETPGMDLMYPVWSPDGSRMVYYSAPTGVSNDLASYIISPDLPWEEQSPEKLPPLNTSGAFVVSSWFPDGWLAGYDDQIFSDIVLFSTSSREYRMFPAEGPAYPAWMSDGRRLLYGVGQIKKLDTVSGSTSVVLSVPPDRVAYPCLTHDDRWLYFTRWINEADIWMLTLEEEQ